MNAPATSRVDALLETLDALPYVSREVPAVTGKLRTTPEDFEVEELPAYEPSGEGEHLVLWIEKRGLNTKEAAYALARALEAPLESVGWAGLKDRHAVTRQWLSFHTKASPSAEALTQEGLRVLSVSRHGNKLRTGHLHGNRFALRLRDVPHEHDAHVEATLALLARAGLPNYFGLQRFGHGGNNVRHAFRWIVEEGRAPKTPFLRKLNVSVLQAALFNVWLAQRIDSETLARAVDGDVMRKEDTGGMFVSEDAEADAKRVTSWEISPTGPMFGATMRAAARSAREIELGVLLAWGVTEAQLARVKKFGEGTRRPARVRPARVELTREGPDLLLRFDLPKGAYATTLVAELMKAQPGDMDEPEP